MSRKIQDPEEAAETPKADAPIGVTFVKNQVNELLKFEDGTTYKFQSSRETVHDPKAIENIRATAAKYGVFEVTQS